MCRQLRLIVFVTAAMAAASFGWAQGAPGSPAPALPPAGSAAPTVAAPSAAEPYTYDPEGRRDPFVSLVARGTEPAAGVRSSGLGGMTTSDLVLKGVLQSRNAYVAIVAGPDGKTY